MCKQWLMHGQVKFRREPVEDEGRRSRKKAKTRLAIEDAALALFAKQGYEATTLEQIAERADISTATFFHYFRGKADVVLSDHDSQLPALCEAILERPSSESDLTAVRRALLQTWVAAVDPERTARTARAVASSALLQGMSYKIGRTWLVAISEALARRRGESEACEQSLLAAHVVLAVFANGVEEWIEDRCREDMATVIERSFDSMAEMTALWSKRDQARMAK
jgi:AcrR family transcriptional regulator